MLGVSTQQRDRMLPQVPTVAESGVPGFDTANWFGVVAPASVPPEVVVRVGQAICEATHAGRPRWMPEGATAAESAAKFRVLPIESFTKTLWCTRLL
jgi:tripartite-type tricarboxylate transporter receptor subunit TctC